jgi:hypothetical protein
MDTSYSAVTLEPPYEGPQEKFVVEFSTTMPRPLPRWQQRLSGCHSGAHSRAGAEPAIQAAAKPERPRASFYSLAYCSALHFSPTLASSPSC